MRPDELDDYPPSVNPDAPAPVRVQPVVRHWCVYALLCNGEIRYIGITSQKLSRRLSQHLSDAKRTLRKEHKTNWIRKCLNDGEKVEIKPLRKWMDENDACRIEQQIIAKLRSNLVNTHEGGATGYSGLPPESKIRHKEAMKRFNETPRRIEWAKNQSKIMHEAKARKRLEGPAPDYPAPVDYDRLKYRITVESFGVNGNSESHVVELFPARGGRRDQFRALVNGTPWKDCISRSDVFAALRRAR